jgi:hypothetical protein
MLDAGHWVLVSAARWTPKQQFDRKISPGLRARKREFTDPFRRIII